MICTHWNRVLHAGSRGVIRAFNRHICFSERDYASYRSGIYRFVENCLLYCSCPATSPWRFGIESAVAQLGTAWLCNVPRPATGYLKFNSGGISLTSFIGCVKAGSCSFTCAMAEPGRPICDVHILLMRAPRIVFQHHSIGYKRAEPPGVVLFHLAPFLVWKEVRFVAECILVGS